MSLSNMDTLNLTKMASSLSRESLALMATISNELSWWERRVQMPMLALDMEFLEFWMLAGVKEHGMLDSAQKRRAAERAKKWRELSKGSWSSSGRYPHWSGAFPSGAMMLFRFICAWGHFGVALGRRKGLRFGNEFRSIAIAVNIFLMFVVTLVSSMVFDTHKSELNMDNPGWLVGLVGPGVFIRALAMGLMAVAAARVILFAFMSPMAKLEFAAQGAGPWAWRLGRSLMAKWEERAQSRHTARARAKAAKFESISAALKRASLGQDSSPEEQELEAGELARARERERALKEASDPSLAFSKQELAQIDRGLAGGKAAPSRRL